MRSWKVITACLAGAVLVGNLSGCLVLKKDYDVKVAQLEECQSSLEQTKGELTKSQAALANAGKDLADARTARQKDIAAVKSKLAVANAENDRLKADLAKLKVDHAAALKELKIAQGRAKNAFAVQGKLETQLAAQKAKLAELTQMVQRLQSQIEKLEAKVKNMQAKPADAKLKPVRP